MGLVMRRVRKIRQVLKGLVAVNNARRAIENRTFMFKMKQPEKNKS